MNWGNRLIAVFIFFAAGMSLLVYKALTTNYELVDKDYYKQELRYQQIIDGKNEAGNLSTSVEFIRDDQGMTLQLPPEMKAATPTGTIFFYCANNSKKDRKFSLNTDSSGQQFFIAGTIPPGSYVAKISWNAGSKNYYAEKNILIP